MSPEKTAEPNEVEGMRTRVGPRSRVLADGTYRCNLVNMIEQSVHTVVMCSSVCLCVSVTLWYCMKRAKHGIAQIMPHDRPGTPVSILTSASRSPSAIAELHL